MKNLKKIIKKLVEVSFRDGKIVEFQVIKSIKILKSLPKAQVIDALTAYLRQLKLRQRQYTLYLETVIPVSSAQIEKIKKIAEKKITKVVTRINPEILGGFKLKLGDDVWDGSVNGKLSQVKEAIANG